MLSLIFTVSVLSDVVVPLTVRLPATVTLDAVISALVMVPTFMLPVLKEGGMALVERMPEALITDTPATVMLPPAKTIFPVLLMSPLMSSLVVGVVVPNPT